MRAEKADVWAVFIGETMRLGARIVIAWAAVVEWGWLRGLGAAFAVLILEDALIRPDLPRHLRPRRTT